MLCTWIFSFVGASVGALYAMCVGFKVFLHLSMLYAWVLKLFPDLHDIHVGFKLCRCFCGSSLCYARGFQRFSPFKYVICVGFKVISRSTCYTRGF